MSPAIALGTGLLNILYELYFIYHLPALPRVSVPARLDHGSMESKLTTGGIGGGFEA